MTQAKILAELKHLTTTERLTIIEAALRQIREDFQRSESTTEKPAPKSQLTEAAKTLLTDYASGGELTAFTSLDSEDFHG